MNLSGATAPNDIWILDLESSEIRQLTHSPHAGVDLDTMVRPELVTYAAHDGLGLSAWLYRPPGVPSPAPYVLSFHGGPEGQERPRFRSDYQALLARGIGVFAPNVRGSSGFGKRFVNLDNGALRYDGIKDIEASVGFLVDEAIGDPKRLGIMGGSYGGYMTMAGLAWRMCSSPTRGTAFARRPTGSRPLSASSRGSNGTSNRESSVLSSGVTSPAEPSGGCAPCLP